jgi:hypothetical protein
MLRLAPPSARGEARYCLHIILTLFYVILYRPWVSLAGRDGPRLGPAAPWNYLPGDGGVTAGQSLSQRREPCQKTTLIEIPVKIRIRKC